MVVATKMERKYDSAIKELAKTKELHKQRLKAFHRDLAWLSMLGDGIDPQLDTQLKSLRAYLNNDSAIQTTIHDKVKAISKPCIA